LEYTIDWWGTTSELGPLAQLAENKAGHAEQLGIQSQTHVLIAPDLGIPFK